jgi:hypothetical protein
MIKRITIIFQWLLVLFWSLQCLRSIDHVEGAQTSALFAVWIFGCYIAYCIPPALMKLAGWVKTGRWS